MAENDISNFSSSSSHRLPTISASAALQSLTSNGAEYISTGLSHLDALLQQREYDLSSPARAIGGLTRGHVTEIYGPPGVGKSTLAIEICRSALISSGSVVWVDCMHSVVGSRLKDIILRDDVQESTPVTPSNHLNEVEIFERLHHFSTPTLPHLLALLTHTSTSFPPPKTSLIVVDAVSSLFNLAFPKRVGTAASWQDPAKKSDAVQWADSRKWSVMSDFVSKIGRLAATKHIAILLTMQTTTRIRADAEACLYPAITGTAWDNGIHARIALFRDWLPKSGTSSSQGKYESGSRCAAVVKAGGVSYEGFGRVMPFRIKKDGVEAINVEQAQIRTSIQPTLKRKRDEIASSQSDDLELASDEEYGWTGDDEATMLG